MSEPVWNPVRTGIAFDYRHETTGIQARVRYWIDGDNPWFRKQLTLEAPDSPAAPTPDRLWVDLQENPPRPIRRVGYSVRGGPDAEEQSGLDSYAPPVPGCGYPVWAGDWFAGLEHPVGFTVPGDSLELFHHPVWDDERRIESYTAVYGAAKSHEAVRDAFMDYLWQIRLPRLSKPIFHLSVGWSVRYLGNREYLDSFEMNQAYAEAVSELGLKPDSLAFDAGWFDRKSIYRHKGDDEEDSRLIAFAEDLKQKGIFAGIVGDAQRSGGLRHRLDSGTGLAGWRGARLLRKRNVCRHGATVLRRGRGSALGAAGEGRRDGASEDRLGQRVRHPSRFPGTSTRRHIICAKPRSTRSIGSTAGCGRSIPGL